MDNVNNVVTTQSLVAQFSMLDYAIVASLVGISTYWFFFMRKNKNEFDASTIKTFALE